MAVDGEDDEDVDEGDKPTTTSDQPESSQDNRYDTVEALGYVILFVARICFNESWAKLCVANKINRLSISINQYFCLVTGQLFN